MTKTYLQESRLEIPVPFTDYVHRATTVCQSDVNFNNLISITTPDSRVSVNRSQSSIKLLSCRQIATDMHDLIVDSSVDVSMLTDTWLYSHGTYTRTVYFVCVCI